MAPIACEKGNHPPKLKRIPKSHRISKRPPLRPAIPSPYTSASSPKVIYVSINSPFHSVVKRVRKLLHLSDQRATGKADVGRDKLSDQESLRLLAGRSTDAGHQSELEREEVLLKGTGKAVAKVLGLGLFFSHQSDLKIRVATGTVSVVDDIMEIDRAGAEQDFEKEGDESEVSETRLRKTSMVEVGISLK